MKPIKPCDKCGAGTIMTTPDLKLCKACRMSCDLEKEWCERCSVESICCAEKLCDICREE